MSAAQILRVGLGRIILDGWRPGETADVLRSNDGYFATYLKALFHLRRASGEHIASHLWLWDKQPGRTIDHVKAVYHAAITAAEQEEAYA